MPEQETELKELEAVDGATEATPAGPTVVPPSAEATVSRAEFDQLKTERDQLQDRLARQQAEFENARKRAERERVEFRDYATGSVVEQFLPVLDNFALALNAKGTTEQLRSGVEEEALIHYDRVLKLRGSVMAAVYEDESCSACRVRLRPQVFQDVTTNQQFVTCFYCNRILYYVPPPPKEEEAKDGNAPAAAASQEEEATQADEGGAQ